MIQIAEQSHDEKMAMYMKLSKRELAAMLIQANLHLESKPLSYIKPHVSKDVRWA
jgi:hypothetical protein